MFSNEKKEIFNDPDFTLTNFMNNSKFKLSQLNDLKWINYILLEITIFQLIFFGLFSIFSIIVVTLQIYLFYKIYSFFKSFPVYESCEIDRLCIEISNLNNSTQIAFYINVIEIFLFIFKVNNSIGKDNFSGIFSNKFNNITIFISVIKILIIYLIRMKINKANMRAEIVNNQ